jgi:hypothetical protein
MITIKSYERRLDLATKEQPDLYYMPDYGSIVCVAGQGWYCTNDCRSDLVGKVPNDQLVQPTLGPFKSATEAVAAREDRHRGQ